MLINKCKTNFCLLRFDSIRSSQIIIAAVEGEFVLPSKRRHRVCLFHVICRRQRTLAASMSSDSEYDVCRMSQEATFSPEKHSPFRPVVGLCGHSFCAQSIRDWHESRKKLIQGQTNCTVLPCAFRCSERVNGATVSTEINAFRPSALVTNHVLCQAIEEIRTFEKSKTIFKTNPFYQCSLCHLPFSTEALAKTKGRGANGKAFQHSPQTPIVGTCGHTFCAACLQSHGAAKLPAAKPANRKTNVKGPNTTSCPSRGCRKTNPFTLDNMIVNYGLRDALRHWQALQEESKAAENKGTETTKKASGRTKTAKYTKKNSGTKRSRSVAKLDSTGGSKKSTGWLSKLRKRP
jgi:RING-type zinc-finger